MQQRRTSVWGLITSAGQVGYKRQLALLKVNLLGITAAEPRGHARARPGCLADEERRRLRKYRRGNLRDSGRGADVCGRGGSRLVLVLVVATGVSRRLCRKPCEAVVRGVMHIHRLSPAAAEPPADTPDVPGVLSSLCCTKPFPAGAGGYFLFRLGWRGENPPS